MPQKVSKKAIEGFIKTLPARQSRVEQIRGEEKEKILREGIRKELAPKPTAEERITKIDERMLARQGKKETYQEKIKGKKVTQAEADKAYAEALAAAIATGADKATAKKAALVAGQKSYKPPPESVILVYKRNLAQLEAKDRADNKLLVKLTGEQAGRKPAPGQYAEKMGPPAPGKIAGDGTPTRPFEIQESQEQFDALPSGAWFRLPSDPPGKARQKP